MNEVKRVVSVFLYLVAWGRGERHDRDIVSWYFCDRRYVSRFLSMVTTENQWNDSVSVKDPYSIEKNKLSIKKKTINSFQRPTVRDRDAYDVSRKRVWWDRLWRYGYCVVLSLGPIAGWDAGWVSLSSWFVSVTSAPFSLPLCSSLSLSALWNFTPHRPSVLKLGLQFPPHTLSDCVHLEPNNDNRYRSAEESDLIIWS